VNTEAVNYSSPRIHHIGLLYCVCKKSD